jgi:hypothetical protein
MEENRTFFDEEREELIEEVSLNAEMHKRKYFKYFLHAFLYFLIIFFEFLTCFTIDKPDNMRGFF